MSMINDDTDHEGAIDTGDDTMQAAQSDNSGAPPVSPQTPGAGDNSGQPAIPPPNMGAQQQDGAVPGFNPQGNGPLAPAARGVKSIISYLMGSDAAHPDQIDQAGAKIDPHGQMPPADRNLLAIDQAREQGGDQAAWALMQANRVAYNAQTAFAKTALQGTQQKPADLKAAIDAANKAQANVLDGSNISFAASPQGAVTATVTMAGTQQAQTVNLTPQQFGQFLDVGGDGQWDKIMEHSAPATLQRIASSGGGQASPQGPQGASRMDQWQPVQKPAAAQAQPQAPQAAPQTPQTNFGKTPSTVNLSGSNDQQAPQGDKTNYGAELEARAFRMFGGDQQKRDQWMAAQEEKELVRKNAVDVAAEKGKWADKRAETAGGYHVQGAQITADARVEGAKLYSGAKLEAAKASNAAKIKQLEQSGANKAEEGARKLAQTYLMTAQPVPPALQKYLDTVPGSAMAATQHSQPQAPQAPQSQGQGQPPVPGAKNYKGQWYTRGPNGESVPVQ